MITKLTGGTTLSTAAKWATNLTERIQTGDYKSQAASWVSCIDVKTAQECALEWVTDSNKINCEYVWVSKTGSLNNTELSGAYYTGAVPYIETQIAKGGYRLAKWLDNIVDAIDS